MGSFKNIDIELIGIGKAILNKRLAVPFYQRSYAWEDKHVLDLLADIANAINNSESEYFIGSIVTTKNNTPRPEVVDGQQRLATASILIAAIRDYLFNNGDVDTHGHARGYLRAIEKQSSGEEYPELVPNDNEEVVNLEHILPLNPSITWNHMSDDDKEAYAKRIGNMALIVAKINSEAGNDSFAFKKQFYKKSAFTLTAELASYKTWTISEIVARQAALAQLAVKTWPLI